MAISIGESSVPVSQKYIGYGLFEVIAINPDQVTLETLLGRKIKDFKGYTSVADDGKTQRLRITFLLRDVSLPEKPIIQYSVFLRRETRKNKDLTKTQVIDIYGNTAWVTDEQFKAKARPTYANGKEASIFTPYQACCAGYDKLIDFLKTWLYTPNSFKWDDEKKMFVPKPAEELERCVIDLNIKDYWNGDVSELQELVKDSRVQSHTINALAYLRSSEYNGNQILIQDLFWKMTPSFSTTTAIEKEWKRELTAGMHVNDRCAFQSLFKFDPKSIPSDAQQTIMGTPWDASAGQASPVAPPQGFAPDFNGDFMAGAEALKTKYANLPPLTEEEENSLPF